MVQQPPFSCRCSRIHAANTFTLQSAPAATGIFTNISSATSPYTNSFTAPKQFFRLIAN